MAWRDDWRRVRAIARKDLTTELRAKVGFNSMASLGVTILILIGLALGPDSQALRNAAVGAVWLAILFSGVLAFSRSFQVELETGALESLLQYPGPRWTLLAGKLLGNLIFMTAMIGILVVVGIVLFGVTIPADWPSLLGVLMLGNVGLVLMGTFYASMASRSRAREVLLPLLLFPMLVPVLLAATAASKALLGADLMHESGAWIRLLAAYDLVFLIATFLAFEHVIEA
ncbi:MAG TPA: heme exporter protein CcmB [Gemmatimonadaceae bacterium]|nr:heme exporter protein CcmB [Gemmatimonadaceae bacterium]